MPLVVVGLSVWDLFFPELEIYNVNFFMYLKTRVSSRRL